MPTLTVSAPPPFRLGVKLKDDATALTVAEDLFQYVIPSELNALTLRGVIFTVTTTSSGGVPTLGVRKNAATEMLSTAATIDVGQLSSDLSATPPVVNAANAAVATGDVIHFDCDVAGTGAKGAFVELRFQ